MQRNPHQWLCPGGASHSRSQQHSAGATHEMRPCSVSWQYEQRDVDSLYGMSKE